MRVIKHLTAILCFILLFSGCMATSSPKLIAKPAIEIQQPQPNWVTGQSIDHPHLSYITARTSADTETTAKALAVEKLSVLFAVNIEQTGMTIEQADKTVQYKIINSISTDKQHWVAAKDAERVLNRIKIVGHWHDRSTGKHHALAVIARNSSEGFLRQQINNIDSLTESIITQARTSNDPLTQTGLFAQAWRAQQIRAKLQSSMRIADVTGRGIKPQWHANKLKKECLATLTHLKIYPTGMIEDLNAQRVTNILTGGLKVADLTNAEETQASYILRGTLDISIAGAEGRWALGHGVFKLVMADSVSGKIRGSKIIEIKTPGLDENAARRRVAEKAEYLIKKEMRNILIDMAI